MKTITWSTRAQEDLQQLYDFYISINENAAVRLYNEVIRETEILSSFPYLGPQEPLFKERKFCYRSLTTRRGLHKIIYFVDKDHVHIARIWDCRQSPAKIKK